MEMTIDTFDCIFTFVAPFADFCIKSAVNHYQITSRTTYDNITNRVTCEMDEEINLMYFNAE